MRKIFITSLFISFTIICSAQVKPGIFGGPQMTSANYSVDGKKQPATAKYGFNLGVSLKVPFENKLFFSPAIFYSMKGYKVKFNQRSFPPDSAATDNNTLIHTVELAALLHYDLGSKPGHFYVKFGPSIDVQLSGKEKFNRNNNTAVDKKMIFSFTQYGRFGANILLQLGYETKNGLLFSGQYGHGIGSINNADFGPSIRHKVWGIIIGKYLDRKRK
jgi:hypothetical protein